jgi:catechol 2,3-dioxygenase-like lactoylglutathione lyase family enzyme
VKRFHVHVQVSDLNASVRFYSTLFGEPPVVLKHDYAKWMLEDPRVNFAITSGAGRPAIDHLGFQVESDDELSLVTRRLDAAGQSVVKQDNATCCYARGNKGWINDPSGISWETFHTFGESTVYGDDTVPRAVAEMPRSSDACCAPVTLSASACCGASKAEQASGE